MINIEMLKDIVEYGFIGLLGLMSFISVMLYIERLFFYRSLDLKQFQKKEELEISVTNNISIIASFASNAPYIGLLGTVFGIIITFYTMGETGNIDVKNIMSSLALALKATAAGLFVAIPSMMFYNHLSRKIEVIFATWDMDNDAS